MKKNLAKILVDIIMTIMFLLLMDTSATGLYWHEVLGLIIFGIFFIHKLLNWQWIKNVCIRFFNPKIKPITKALFILDALLVLFMTATVISGIFISKIIFTFISLPDNQLWTVIHSSSAYISLILISVHVGFHWRNIMAAFRKMFFVRQESRFRRVALRAIVISLVIFGVKSSIENDIGGKIIALVPKEDYKSTSVATVIDVNYENAGNNVIAENTVLISNTTVDSSSVDGLNNFLGSMFCTACPKHCSLLSPQCSRGVVQAQQATKEYYSTQSASQATDSSAAVQQDATTQQDVAGSSSETPNSDVKTNDITLDESNVINEDNVIVEGESGDSLISLEDGEANAGITNNLESIKEPSLFDPFENYIPIMSLYIAGTYYLIEFIDKRKKNRIEGF